MKGQDGERLAAQLARGLAQLDPEPDDKEQARKVLLGHMTRSRNGVMAASLARVLAQLDPTPPQRQQARDTLMGWLTRDWTAGEVDGPAQDSQAAWDKQRRLGSFLARGR